MTDIDALLQPVLDDSPAPPPFDSVRARATKVHRWRIRRRLGAALVAVVLVGLVAFAIAGREPGHSTIAVRPVEPKARTVRIGTPATFTYPAMDMMFAFGSIWISQPDRVAHVDPTTGAILATIPVPGESDFRNLAAGAGSVWVDDTGTQTVTRIDAGRNHVTKTIRLAHAPLVVDGLAFVDGKLWVVRLDPEGFRGDVVAIDPTTNTVAEQATIPRTFSAMSNGSDALWYVRGTDLLRFDTHTLHTSLVRRAVADVLAVAGSRLWVLAGSTVFETDASTGATIGEPIRVRDAVNVTVEIGAGVVWIAGQPDSSSPGTVTPYDPLTHRPIGPPTAVGLPILTMTDIGRALWVDAGGLRRIPFTR